MKVKGKFDFSNWGVGDLPDIEKYLKELAAAYLDDVIEEAFITSGSIGKEGGDPLDVHIWLGDICGDDKSIEFNLKEVIKDHYLGEDEYRQQVLAFAKH